MPEGLPTNPWVLRFFESTARHSWLSPSIPRPKFCGVRGAGISQPAAGYGRSPAAPQRSYWREVAGVRPLTLCPATKGARRPRAAPLARESAVEYALTAAEYR